MPTETRRSSFKRWHPYLGEWIVFAPTTAVRPWNGTVVTSSESSMPDYDPGCYLCPGVKRAGGDINPEYTGVYVFDNDYPSLSMNSVAEDYAPAYSSPAPAKGICRVVCFSPRHNITLAEMPVTEIRDVLRSFSDQFIELSSIPDIKHVLMFENKGSIIGVSNPHPHGQIYASDFIPRIPLQQVKNAETYMQETGECIFCAVLAEELRDGRRIVCQNDLFVALVPSFARYSFEIHIMPRRHVASIDCLSNEEIDALAEIYSEVLIRYDNLFEMSFPNITLFRNAPCDTEIQTHSYHFHIEFCPPLRSRDKLKYMAGFETGGGNIINPSLPREAADALKFVPAVHYRQRQEKK